MMQYSADVIYLEWGDAKRSPNVQEINRIVDLSGLRLRNFVMVDNKSGPREAIHDGFISISGDNKSREFSGWDRGLEYLHSITTPADVILFFNDTFATHRRIRVTRRARLARWMRYAAADENPVLFGQVDPTIEPGLEHPLGNIDDFLCSYFIGLNKASLPAMTPFCEYEDIFERVLNSDPASSEELTNEIGPKYRAHFRRYFHDPGAWIGGVQPLNPANFAFFRLKVKSILYEHSLVVRARERGSVQKLGDHAASASCEASARIGSTMLRASGPNARL